MSNKLLLIGWQKRWNRTLLQFLGRRVRASIDIEDLAQETYLRLLRARDLRDVRNPQAYLLRVASHVVAEWRDHEPAEDPLNIGDEELLVDQNSPEFELDAVLSEQRLNAILSSISPLMRAVLLMKFRDDRSCKEIATELRITPRQVRRHLTKGYASLRQALDG